jgi:pimeloyl-ACP methyl ester carboxylesterase
LDISPEAVTTVPGTVAEFSVEGAGMSLAGEEAGEGTPVVLLHGLTATRRYVVMGSRSLERSGHHVISYDARAHGRSSAAPLPDAYTYELLTDDLERVLDSLSIERAVLAGVSMGSHTILALALRAPERVAGLVVITPAYSGPEAATGVRIERWDQLSSALRDGGIEGFIDAYGDSGIASPRLAQTIQTVIRQRMALHEHLDALADALAWLPRTTPFEEIGELAAIEAPTVIVGSSDGADPEHPFAVAQAYSNTIPNARLLTEPAGSSPLAWQGSQVSKIIAQVAAAAVF